MDGTVYVFLADGFEEIEALTPVDVLRRADMPVTTVGVTGKTVTGGHAIRVEADRGIAGFVLPQDAAMVVLPGGTAGVEHIMASTEMDAVLAQAAERGIYIAAICAGPLALQKAGLTKGKRLTAFPAVRPQLVEGETTGEAVVVDGKMITGRSAGVSLQFAYALLAALQGKEKADEIVGRMYP